MALNVGPTAGFRGMGRGLANQLALARPRRPMPMPQQPITPQPVNPQPIGPRIPFMEPPPANPPTLPTPPVFSPGAPIGAIKAPAPPLPPGQLPYAVDTGPTEPFMGPPPRVRPPSGGFGATGRPEMHPQIFDKGWPRIDVAPTNVPFETPYLDPNSASIPDIIEGSPNNAGGATSPTTSGIRNAYLGSGVSLSNRPFRNKLFY